MSSQHKKAIPVFYIPLRTTLKICASVVFVSLIFMWFANFLDIGLPLRLYQSPNKTRKDMEEVIRKVMTTENRDGNEMKTVLYWTKMWNNATFYFGEGDIFKDCEVSACRATYDRNFMKIEDFDALIFHGIEIAESDLPPARSPKQKYIFADLESPVTWPLSSTKTLNGFYNWTMTYRRDSDIPWPFYGRIVDSVTKDIVYPIWAGTNARVVAKYAAHEKLHSSENNITFEGKRKTAAWFVSHCNTAGLRDNYVAELRKYIDVDIYGKCGSLSCSNGDMSCYEMLESRYYFYLSFENSLCQDYVTEKLFKVMAYNVVPIVYGGANYSDYAPPGSYINVVDFESPKLLAEHLRYLMSNPEEYAKFFWWKKHLFIDRSNRAAACQMCKMLHNKENLASSSVSKLNKWWSRGKCPNSADFLKKITRN